MKAATEFEAVIGLEVHVQLKTVTKLFCGCRNEYGAAPNQNICQVCTGQPGVLPVLNQAALRLALRAGLALGCEIASRTKFDRKNYFYPDLPKGYQISQFDRPVNGPGGLEIEADRGQIRRIGILRAHLEEDAGKTMHPVDQKYSLLDFNRAGIPLLEIVSEPELRSPEEAHRYLTALKRILRFARVSDCDMEQGSLRCDANVSIRPVGSSELLTRTETKNLNSFRNVERALCYEIERQGELVAGGGAVVQETLCWREDQGCTESLRSKEDSHDYRYFPDPDLPEFVIDPELIAEIRAELPELPASRLARYTEQLGLTAELAAVLASEPEISDYFDDCQRQAAADPSEVAKYVTGSLSQIANQQETTVDRIGIAPPDLLSVLRLVQLGELSHQAARKVLPAMAETGHPPDQVVRDLGLAQLSDRAQLQAIVEQVMADSKRAVTEYRAGKQAALNSLIGGVMKATHGKANPNLVRELLIEQLR